MRTVCYRNPVGFNYPSPVGPGLFYERYSVTVPNVEYNNFFNPLDGTIKKKRFFISNIDLCLLKGTL